MEGAGGGNSPLKGGQGGIFSAASKAFKKVYQHGYKPDDLFTVPEYTNLITETKAAFDPAIEYVQSDVLKSYLDQDAFVFSGLKAHKELTNARALLKDENGNIRPWNQFEQAILKLNNTYNRLYLEAEYEFAVHSAQSADRWSSLNDDTNRYWLQYRTAQDKRVRENHQILAGTTLPKDDPFWDEYYPPNGWRCRCVAVEVLARNNTKSNSAEAIKKGMEATTSLSKSGTNKLAMFRFNPGKEQKLFPPKNSYMPRGCGGTLNITDSVFLALDDEACRAKKLIEEKAEKYYKPYVKKTLKTYKNGGVISSSNLVNIKSGDYDRIYACCKHFAKQGEDTEILPKFSATLKNENYKKIYKNLNETPFYGKCPDFRVGNIFYEHEGFDSITHSISNMFRRGLKQSSRLIIDDDGSTMRHVKKVIHQRIKEGQIIDEVWVLRNDMTLKLAYKSENPTY